MPGTPEARAPGPGTALLAKEVAVFIHEFHPNPLAIDVIAGGRIDGVDPDHQSGFIQRDIRARIRRAEEFNYSARQPWLDRLNHGFPADVMLSTEGHSLNLKNPAVTQPGTGEGCAGEHKESSKGKETSANKNQRQSG